MQIFVFNWLGLDHDFEQRVNYAAAIKAAKRVLQYSCIPITFLQSHQRTQRFRRCKDERYQVRLLNQKSFLERLHRRLTDYRYHSVVISGSQPLCTCEPVKIAKIFYGPVT